MHKNADAAEVIGMKRDFTNREFVRMVRAELAAGGHDVTIERNWIDEDTPGEPFLLMVPVGTQFVVPVKAMDGFFLARTDEDRSWHAREFAKALVNLKSAEETLEKYARDVRRAANAAIAAARAGGLDILLENVGFKPTYAYHLTNASWKEAAYHVLGAVTVRHTSFYLRPTTSELWVEEPADINSELESILKDQSERQQRIAEMEAQGADLIVDPITLDLLAAHGIDAEDALRQVWKNQHVGFKVNHLGHDTTLSLLSSEGRVTASIALYDAIWNGEHLWLTRDRASDYGDFVGKSLGNLVPHPVFKSRRVVAADKRQIYHFMFDLSEKVFFDGDTGRIWREERLAA